MTITPVQRVSLTAPTPTPLRGVLLDAISTVDGVPDLNFTENQYESYNCLTTGYRAVYPCPTPDPLPPAKTFNTPAWQDGFKFAAYGGVRCSSVGFDLEFAQAELTRVFDVMESKSIAQGLMENRFRALADYWPAPTDITPAGGAVVPKVGLALIEGLASTQYAGVPTIHVPRSIGSLLIDGGSIAFKGDRLETGLGAKVAADGGYESNFGPDGVAAPAGEKWIYGTGEVQAQRSAPVFQEWAINMSNNDITILRERVYVLTVDCFATAVRVKVSA